MQKIRFGNILRTLRQLFCSDLNTSVSLKGCFSKQLPVMFEPDETNSFVVVLRTDPLTNTADTGLWNMCICLAKQHSNAQQPNDGIVVFSKMHFY